MLSSVDRIPLSFELYIVKQPKIFSVHLGSSWQLTDDSGAVCLEITGTIILKITYNATDTVIHGSEIRLQSLL